MKRGLVVLDPTEIPEEEWGQRIGAVQERLRAERIDVALIYNDVSRGDDIGYLTNLVIYWNEGMLAIPAEGEATLLTKLSKRVFAWMERTSMITDLRSGQSIGALVSAYLANRQAGRLGFVDADLWPALYVEEIASAVPDWEIVELGAVIREQRKVLSSAEQALLRTGAGVLAEALEAATAAGEDVRSRMGALESVARHGGFADVVLRGLETGERATIEVAAEYRHNWLLVGRSYGVHEDAALIEARNAALSALASGATWTDAGLSGLAALEASPVTNAALTWISQTDFANRGELRAPLEGRPVDGEVAALQIEFLDDAGCRAVRTDTFLVGAGHSELLTN